MLRKILSVIGMKAKFYSKPKNVGGWICWLEDRKGQCLGFIHQDGRVSFNWRDES